MDRILPIPPGPKTTAEDLVRIRQIEAIRLSLRLLDRQLEASAKAAANGSPQHLAFKNACEKFLAELADIRSGERYQKIHAQVAKSMPPPESSIALESDKPDKVVDAEGQIDLVEPNEASVTLTPFDRAQLLVDKEAIEAREKYESDRTFLLEKLQQIQEGNLPAEEKAGVLEGLNLVEGWYSKIWRSLESGARGAEILRDIEKSTRSSSEGKRKTQGTSNRPHAPKTRIKKKSSLNQFQAAIRKIEQEERQQARMAAQRRELQGIVQSRPHRNNSTSHDRVYVTSGFRNPRAKK